MDIFKKVLKLLNYDSLDDQIRDSTKEHEEAKRLKGLKLMRLGRFMNLRLFEYQRQQAFGTGS